jgi:hypothetical protein
VHYSFDDEGERYDAKLGAAAASISVPLPLVPPPIGDPALQPFGTSSARETERSVDPVLAEKRMDVVKPVVICGPPGSGKTTIISTLRNMGYMALDLEQSHRRGIQRSAAILRLPIFYGAAEITPQSVIDAGFHLVLLLPSENVYYTRRRMRDSEHPYKAGQRDNYSAFNNPGIVRQAAVVFHDESLHEIISALTSTFRYVVHKGRRSSRRTPTEDVKGGSDP